MTRPWRPRLWMLAPVVIGGTVSLTTADVAPGTPHPATQGHAVTAHSRRNVPLYRRVEYRDVYPGVGLTYYESQGQLEYDFAVSPGADPRVIRIEFEGAKGLRLGPEGSLVVETVVGELVQRAPVVYQGADGVRKPIKAEYVLKGGKRVGFKVGRYDRRQALVIDPVLVYSRSSTRPQLATTRPTSVVLTLTKGMASA